MSVAFQRQIPRIRAAAERGLYRTANSIISTSIGLVPVETGTLRASARVNLPSRVGGGRIEVRAGYGYGNLRNPLSDSDPAGYAPFVEFRTDLHHPHGQAHFLRDAALAHIQSLGPNIRVELDRGGLFGIRVMQEGGE